MKVGPVGQRLRGLRLAAGLSQRALDRKAGVTQGLAAMYERGARQNIHAETAKKYAAALVCDWVWLFDGTGTGAPKARRRVA